LITNDCEVDKAGRRLLICPVVPLDRIPGGDHGNVKKNKVISMLFIPAYRALVPDSFVDFNQITTVDRSILRAGKRVLSLSDLGRTALYNQFIRWTTRWVLHTIECPRCGVEFDPTLKLPVRADD